MKLKNSKVVAVHRAMVDMAKNQKLPFKVRYAIVRSLKEVEPVVNKIEFAQNELIKEFAKVDEDGNMIPAENGGVVLKEDKIEAYYKALQDLSDEESEDIKFHTFDYELLEGVDNSALHEVVLMDILITVKE